MNRVILFVFFLFDLCWAHPSADLHIKDIIGIFDGYGDDGFRELARRVSTGVDHELPKTFREQLGSVPGNHRILGHGWALNDAIPSQTLEVLESYYPGQRKKLLEYGESMQGI